MSTPIGLRPVQNYEIDTDCIQPGDVYLLEISEDSFYETFGENSKDIYLYQKHMYAMCVGICHDEDNREYVEFFGCVKKYETTMSGVPIEKTIITMSNFKVYEFELENGDVSIIERLAQSQADKEAERIQRLITLPMNPGNQGTIPLDNMLVQPLYGCPVSPGAVHITS